MKYLVFIFLILAGCRPDIAMGPNDRMQQFIDWISIESNDGLWGNGMWPSVKLPLTATPKDIIIAFYELPRAPNIAGKKPDEIKVGFSQKLSEPVWGDNNRLMYACYVRIDGAERYIALSNYGSSSRDVWMIYEYDNARLDWNLNEMKKRMGNNPAYREFVDSITWKLNASSPRRP